MGYSRDTRPNFYLEKIMCQYRCPDCEVPLIDVREGSKVGECPSCGRFIELDEAKSSS